MNAQNNISRIRNAYNPDQQDVAVGADGRPVLVTWAEYALLEMIVDQQAEIDALKRQVARLVEATPGGGESSPSRIEDFMAREERRAARHKQNFEEVARMEGKTVAQVERDLCNGDVKCTTV